MRFVFITREGRNDPGARIRCYGFSDKLKEKGFDCSVFSFVDRLGTKSGKDDISFTFREKLKYSYQGFKLLLKEAKDSVFIVNRFNYHTIPTWLISKLRKIPFVFDMDDWETRESRGSRAEYFSRSFAKSSIFCIAASNYLKDYLLQFNKKVYYIPTAVDTDRFKPFLHKKGKNFVFSWHGSVNRPEIIIYIKFIIECFLVLYKKYPFIKLYIAGDGIFSKELVELIHSYRCKDIVYYGRIDYADIPAYLDGVDVGIIPLLDNSKFNLSKSPVKLFEYMAKAKPAVSSNVGEASYIVKNGENGFLADSKEEFIEKMKVLAKNPHLCLQMGEKARQTVESTYSLDFLSKELYKILKYVDT